MDALTLDYTGALSTAVGPEHGVSESELASLADASKQAVEAVQARRDKDLRWLDLPYQEDVLRDVLAYADSVRGRFQNVVVLGIGGSALGNRAPCMPRSTVPSDTTWRPRARVSRACSCSTTSIPNSWIGAFLEDVDPGRQDPVQRHLEVGLARRRRCRSS